MSFVRSIPRSITRLGNNQHYRQAAVLREQGQILQDNVRYQNDAARFGSWAARCTMHCVEDCGSNPLKPTDLAASQIWNLEEESLIKEARPPPHSAMSPPAHVRLCFFPILTRAHRLQQPAGLPSARQQIGGRSASRCPCQGLSAGQRSRSILPGPPKATRPRSWVS